MKQYKNELVLHNWLAVLTFQQQALLMTAMRGPDENNKYNAAKAIIRYLRGTVLKPAGDWRGKNDNDFMWGDYGMFQKYANEFWQDHDEYPHHFIMHLVHCAEVVGYHHPDGSIRAYWFRFYYEACIAFHMIPETADQMNKRLNDFGCMIPDKDGALSDAVELLKLSTDIIKSEMDSPTLRERITNFINFMGV